MPDAIADIAEALAHSVGHHQDRPTLADSQNIRKRQDVLSDRHGDSVIPFEHAKRTALKSYDFSYAETGLVLCR